MRASISILLERNEEISADGGGPGRIHRTSRLLASGGPSNMDTSAWVDGASTVAVSALQGSATSITPSTDLMVRRCEASRHPCGMNVISVLDSCVSPDDPNGEGAAAHRVIPAG